MPGSSTSRKRSGNLLQLALSVGILAILALLVGNVVLIFMALNFNNSICNQAAQAGAEIYANGGEQRDLQLAVVHVLNQNNTGGFFISHPILTELRCYADIDNGIRQRKLLVKTITAVYVPAPFLLFFAHPNEGRLYLSSKCTVNLKHNPLSS